MDRLPHTPRTFADIVAADLRRAARLIIKHQDELDPQFRIATPEGDYALAITFPVGASARADLFGHLATFCAWKRAIAVTMAFELSEPDALVCIGLTQATRLACITPITRHPHPWCAANFGMIDWIDNPAIEPSMAALLPHDPQPLTPKAVAAAETLFGSTGTFPAVHVPTGTVRGLASR